MSALTTHANIAIGTLKTAIALHLQPRTMRFVELLRPFVVPQLASLEKDVVATMAVIVKWPDRKVTLDGSGAIANGVFLRLERDFLSTTRFIEIADQLKRDEEQLFNILGVEEDRA